MFNGVFISIEVSGEISNNNGPFKRFVQNFLLDKQEGKECSYYILSDDFKFVKNERSEVENEPRSEDDPENQDDTENEDAETSIDSSPRSYSNLTEESASDDRSVGDIYEAYSETEDDSKDENKDAITSTVGEENKMVKNQC